MKRSIGVVLLAVVAVAAIPSAPAAYGSDDHIESILHAMTLREKAGQLVMASIDGRRLSDEDAEHIRRGRLGGIIVFGRNYSDAEQLTRLTASIQRVGRSANGPGVGMLISADQEGGPVKAFDDMPPTKSHPRLGDLDDTDVAYRQGKRAGRALIAAGVNMNLAPVLDVDDGPYHVMRARSFGSRRRLVGRMGKAFLLGLQDGGVIATAKHFPGIGDVTRNTDFGKGVVYRSGSLLLYEDVFPFERAIGAGVRAIMVGHAFYPGMDVNRPASVSRKVTWRLLRERLGFKGLVISDSLGAIRWYFDNSLREACVATVRAGSDIALGGGSGCVTAIKEAVLEGRMSRAALDRRVRNVLRAKAKLGLLPPA